MFVYYDESVNRVFVPVRWVAEALGADVRWDGKKQSVYIEDNRRQSLQERVQLLEQFHAPASGKETAETWAKAVQMRNGAVQYSLLSPEMQKATLAQFEEIHWVPGVSSPWTEKYSVTPLSVKNKNEESFSIEFQLATSTGDAGSGKVKITVTEQNGEWRITEIGIEENGSLPDLILPPSKTG